MRHPLGEEQAMAEETEHFRRLYGANYKRRWYRKRLGRYAYEDNGILWQRDSFGVYYGIEPGVWRIRFMITQGVNGFWYGYSTYGNPSSRFRAKRRGSPDPIASARRASVVMRVIELQFLDSFGTGKLIGLAP